MTDRQKEFGEADLGLLLRKQALPASVGILVMSVYGIVDTLFVGRYVGTLAIGAITVILPLTFLISSIGMAIGVGGGSILSRAMGEGKQDKVRRTFGNQVSLTIGLSLFFVIIAYFFQIPVLNLFGGKGETLPYAKEYFNILLPAIPALAWAMMSNNVIRAEGHPRTAMYTLLIPAVTNLILDPILIVFLDMGLAGAAWATAISYFASGLFTLHYFFRGPSQMSLSPHCLKLSLPIVKEISSLGAVTLARQGTISLLSIVLNNSLYAFGGEMALSSYGIISRLLMFVNFPVLGITQGYVPILGYNFGARKYDRVLKLSKLALTWASGIAVLIFCGIMVFTRPLVGIFTTDEALIDLTVPSLRWVFSAAPLLATSLLASAFFQAIGEARRALILAMSKQGFFLIPLILIIPQFIGIDGVWWSFPIADLGAALLSWFFVVRSPYLNGQKTTTK